MTYNVYFNIENNVIGKGRFMYVKSGNERAFTFEEKEKLEISLFDYVLFSSLKHLNMLDGLKEFQKYAHLHEAFYLNKKVNDDEVTDNESEYSIMDKELTNSNIIDGKFYIDLREHEKDNRLIICFLINRFGKFVNEFFGYIDNIHDCINYVDYMIDECDLDRTFKNGAIVSSRTGEDAEWQRFNKSEYKIYFMSDYQNNQEYCDDIGCKYIKLL